MIINLVGPCGAGKTTLGRRLSQRLGIPVYSIADFRTHYGSEVEAWSALRERINSGGGIIDSTGLNRRLYDIVLKGKEYLTIKLQCNVEEALRRASPDESTADFGVDFREFVRKSALYAQRLDADWVIDTDELPEEEVLGKALSFIRGRTKNLVNSGKKGIKR